MKKQAINFSWPAQLFDFSQDNTQENFSRVKLRVFYKGETADHRYFSDAFAEEIIKSLPYTPVVSSYDEEKDDFVGHANEQQIFGIVDPCTPPVFETDDEGKEWCVCEVVLYTERPDTVGTLAQKIVGQPQSLELDPHSVKYTINYDEKKHFKNIEFTAGQFVGVSVLGKDQKPAFTGSAFFSCDDKFNERMQILRNYCERGKSQEGGQKMDFKKFIEMSWGDIADHVQNAVDKEYGNEAYTFLIDMYSDYAVYRFYYSTGDRKLLRINYSCDDKGNVTLGNVCEVAISYVPVDSNGDNSNNTMAAKDPDENVSEPVQKNTEVETNMEETVQESAEESADQEAEKTPDQELVKAETVETPETEVEEVKTEESDANCTENQEAATVVVEEENTQVEETPQVEITPNQMEEVRVENEENSTKEETTSSTSFTNREREEFEILKREKRVNLVNSYKENLSEEEYNQFIALANDLNTSEDKLELELLRSYKRSSKQEGRTIRAFSFNPVTPNQTESTLDAFVRMNKRN